MRVKVRGVLSWGGRRAEGRLRRMRGGARRVTQDAGGAACKGVHWAWGAGSSAAAAEAAVTATATSTAAAATVKAPLLLLAGTHQPDSPSCRFGSAPTASSLSTIGWWLRHTCSGVIIRHHFAACVCV